MQPREAIDTTEGLSVEDKVKYIIEDLTDRLPEEFNILELMSKVDKNSCVNYIYHLNIKNNC